MHLDEPSWWYRNPDAIMAKLLQPVALAYGSIAARRLQREPTVQLPIPVICVGNFTAGGTGKTPLAIWTARYLRELELRPVFLSRGYGGHLPGPHLVEPDTNSADEVGDEPLLLAAHAPVVISKDRGLGGQFIVDHDLGNVIVMDDGMQNPTLEKDLVIAVVSASRGIGNGKVIPAGPLRASLTQQLALTDAIVINLDGEAKDDGPDRPKAAPHWLTRSFAGNIASARVAARGDVSWLSERPILAYAGIGNPARFFNLLEQYGGVIRERRAFRDHQQLSDQDAVALLNTARNLDCQLVTTEKDMARLSARSTAQVELRSKSRSLDIELQIAGEQGAQLRGKIKDAVNGK